MKIKGFKVIKAKQFMLHEDIAPYPGLLLVSTVSANVFFLPLLAWNTFFLLKNYYIFNSTFCLIFKKNANQQKNM